MKKKEDFISIVLISEQLNIFNFHKDIYRIHKHLKNHFFDYEIIIIENRPQTIPRKELTILLKKIPSIRFIELSYKIDYEIALTLGLENSIGDFVFIFNISQDPLGVVIPMLNESSVNNMCIGVANNVKKSLGYKIIRPFINSILSEIGYHIPKGATTLRCIPRSIINSATKARNYHHQIFIRISQCDLNSTIFSYSVKNPSKNKKDFFSSIKHGVKLLITNSAKPLRWMSILGVFGSSTSLLFACYSFIVKIINQNIADGWSSTVILISFFFLLLFTILTFFGEYLGRLINDNSNHEPYWVLKEYNSSVMIDSNRQNVTELSDETN